MHGSLMKFFSNRFDPKMMVEANGRQRAYQTSLKYQGFSGLERPIQDFLSLLHSETFLFFLEFYQKTKQKSVAESFYCVKYGSSIITSKIPSKILSNENKKNWCFQKNSLFWHFNSHFVLKTTETPVFMFSLLRFFD